MSDCRHNYEWCTCVVQLALGKIQMLLHVSKEFTLIFKTEIRFHDMHANSTMHYVVALYRLQESHFNSLITDFSQCKYTLTLNK